MTNRLRICARNVARSADFAASPAAESTLPVTNLKIAKRSRVWRSTSAAEQVITIDWNGSAYWINLVALWRHNVESGGTWRVQAYSDAAATTEIYDSAAMEPFDTSTLGSLDDESADADGVANQALLVHYFTAKVLAKALKVTITDTGNADSYIEASYLFAGEYLELTYNAAGESLGWRDTAEQTRSDGGTLQSDAGVTYRELAIDLPAVHADDRARLQDMVRYAGLRRPLFVGLYPDAGGEKERDYTMLGKFAELPDLGMEGRNFGTWAGRLRIAEL